MNTAVYYYTRSGNTKKLADAIAVPVGTEARDIAEPIGERTDIVFLGSSPYAFDVDANVKAFIEQNAEKIGTLVCFGSSASGMSTFKKIKAIAEAKGISVFEEYYNCPGHFKFLHKGRPNASDLDAASAFAGSVLEKIKTLK